MRIEHLMFAGCCFLVCLTGFVICMNLTVLLAPESTYEAGWWKVAFASFLAIMFSGFAYKHCVVAIMKKIRKDAVHQYRNDGADDCLMWIRDWTTRKIERM